ncbi:MAG: PQQ-like beta-propeller repeat protein [Aphanothece sp. CMT-3BRIN-NPC111]|nr:PQQ-like beta-propeller repeat protein [Aphanothece sp. CMT-3BRIN-NPC111]
MSLFNLFKFAKVGRSPKLGFIGWSLLLLTSGCSREDRHYWTQGCISSDESVMAAVGDVAALVDLKTGKLLKQFNAYLNNVVCFPNGDIVGLSSSKVVSLPTGKEIPQGVERDVIGPVGNDQIAVSFRSTDSQAKSRGSLEVSIQTLGAKFDATKVFTLLPNLFKGIGDLHPERLQTRPVRVLSNNQILVLAGSFPDIYAGKVQPAPWGFFIVDPIARTVAPQGLIRSNDDLVNMHTLDETTATPDGKILATAFTHTFSGEKGVAIALMQADQKQEIFRLKIQPAQEVDELRLNPAGDLLAVGIRLPNGQEGQVYMLDGRTGEILWKTAPAKGKIYYMDFLKDDSLVVMTSNRTVSRRNSRNGQIQWENSYRESS